MFGTLAESAINRSLAEEVLAIIDDELIVFILQQVMSALGQPLYMPTYLLTTASNVAPLSSCNKCTSSMSNSATWPTKYLISFHLRVMLSHFSGVVKLREKRQLVPSISYGHTLHQPTLEFES